MGREIRRVPPNWEHPKATEGRRGEYQPMHDEDYETAAEEWLAALLKWERGEDPDREGSAEVRYYWDWNGNPPDKEFYRPKWSEEPTWFQMYETVSEGTPVSPPFATKAELVEYLVAHGDFWDDKRGHPGWSRAAAERFVESEWAPTGIAIVTPTGTTYQTPRDME